MTLQEATEKLEKLPVEKILKLIAPTGKSIVFFDLETNDKDPMIAKICSISVIKINPDNSRIIKHKIVNPGVMMSDEVIEIHGITNEIAQAEPPFSKYAKSFAEFIKDCILVGFNSNYFDRPILIRELEDAGVDVVSIFQNCEFLDVSNIYRHMNRRRLIDAYARYTGEIMSDAHNSAFDSLATITVLEAMMWEHETELPNDVEGLSKLLQDFQPLDLMGKVGKDIEGRICFTFGKYKGQTVESIIGPGGIDQGYYEWMSKGDFHKNTIKVLSDLRNSFRRPATPPREPEKPQPIYKVSNNGVDLIPEDIPGADNAATAGQI